MTPAQITALSPEARAGLARCPKCGRRIGVVRIPKGLQCGTCGTAWKVEVKK